jgi:cbb3-type cytochrome oxidase subunit 3
MTNTERDIENPEVLKMTWFIFIGDMLVMLFMCILVVWVFMKSTTKTTNEAARIPLEDEFIDD